MWLFERFPGEVGEMMCIIVTPSQIGIALVYVIAWLAVQFGINCTSNAFRKVINCTRRSRVQFAFLNALRVQFIPNCTASHAITC